MATPQDLLVKAKSRMGQVGGGGQPNTGGSRGAPGRGGIAARPATGGGLQARRPPRPGAEPALDGQQIGGAGADASGRFPAPGPTNQRDDMTAMQPRPAGKPAWQQLAEQGMGGQGSAAANRAKLAELQLGGSGGIIAPDQVPGAPPMPGAGQMQDLARDSMSADLTRTFPGFKPAAGGSVAAPMPTTDLDTALGRKPRGMGAGPRPAPMPLPTDSPGAAGPGGGIISDPMPPAGGFGDIAAVAAPYAAARAGAGVANRFQPPRAMPTYNPLR